MKILLTEKITSTIHKPHPDKNTADLNPIKILWMLLIYIYHVIDIIK